MPIRCPQNPITGNHIVYGSERCVIDRARFACFRGGPVIIEKDICRKCGETEEIKPGKDCGPAVNPQAPAKKVG